MVPSRPASGERRRHPHRRGDRRSHGRGTRRTRPGVGGRAGGCLVRDVVPEGRLVVLGDGPVSEDSRVWGYVRFGRVLGWSSAGSSRRRADRPRNLGPAGRIAGRTRRPGRSARHANPVRRSGRPR
ncbi:S26 family signal peptidase [Actinoallomurus sp. CA-150999]|uniref:S26 family signal peptidase n=1 Tax=Actinoallomurus sp. CA-150999 TaxID=3239887 RepID=UPI003D8D1C8C